MVFTSFGREMRPKLEKKRLNFFRSKKKSSKEKTSVAPSVDEWRDDTEESHGNVSDITDEKVMTLTATGNTHFNNGEYDDAMNIYVQVLNMTLKSRPLNRLNSSSSNSSFTTMQEKNQSISSRILINIGVIHLHQNELNDAMESFETALELSRNIASFKSENTGIHDADLVPAEVLQNMAVVNLKRREYEQALQRLEEALKIRSTHLQNLTKVSSSKNEGENLLQARLKVASIHKSIGMVYERTGHYRDCVNNFENALIMRRLAVGDVHGEISDIFSLLANVHTDLGGNYTDAMRCWKEALRIRRSLLGEKHPDVVNTVNSIGGVLIQMGDLDAALMVTNDVIKRMSLIEGGEISDEKNLVTAEAMSNKGMIQERMGDLEEAMNSYRETLRIKICLLGGQNESVSHTLNSIANIYYENGDFEEATIVYKEALRMKENAFGPSHPSVAVTLNNIGSVHAWNKDYESALKCHTRALVTFKETVGESHPSVAETLNYIGVVSKHRREFDDAMEHFTEALNIFRRAGLSSEHPGVLSAIRNIADFEHVRLGLHR